LTLVYCLIKFLVYFLKRSNFVLLTFKKKFIKSQIMKIIKRPQTNNSLKICGWNFNLFL